MTQIEKTIEFYANLNRTGLLTLHCTFNKIKYRKVTESGSYSFKTKKGKIKTMPTYTDDAGGFFLKSEVKTMANEFGKNYQTFRKQVSKMVSIGWLIPTQTGYRCIGKQKLFNKYGNELSRLSFHAPTKAEVLKTAAIRFLKVNYAQQLYRQYNCPARKHKHARALLESKDYTVSIRKLQRVLGYKTPMSGLKMEKILEREKLITIEKRSQPFCHASVYPALVKIDETLTRRCFYIGDIVHERLTNNISIVW
jgi:hypothetical protein